VEVMEDVRHYPVEILGVICLISLTVWFIRLLLRRKSARADLLEKGPSRQDQP